MSNEYLGKARRMRVGNSTRKLILIILADNANDDGWCMASTENMARQCECSVTTVQRHIREMERMGILETHPRICEHTGVRKETVYRLLLEDGVRSVRRK